MPTRGLLSEGQRARFSALPDMDRRDLVRHHILFEADLVAVGIRRGAANRLGFAIQLCLLRYPGRPLRSGEVRAPARRHVRRFLGRHRPERVRGVRRWIRARYDEEGARRDGRSGGSSPHRFKKSTSQAEAPV